MNEIRVTDFTNDTIQNLVNLMRKHHTPNRGCDFLVLTKSEYESLKESVDVIASSTTLPRMDLLGVPVEIVPNRDAVFLRMAQHIMSGSKLKMGYVEVTG